MLNVCFSYIHLKVIKLKDFLQIYDFDFFKLEAFLDYSLTLAFISNLFTVHSTCLARIEHH